MGDENPIRTLRDYSKPSHEGYMNTIELPERNNVVPLRSDIIWLVQNGCSFHRLRSEDPNQHLKNFLKLVDSFYLNGDNRERTCMRLFQIFLRDQASNWLERLPTGSISTWGDLTTCFLAQFFPPRRTTKLLNDILMFQQHQGESLSEAWTRFKDLIQKVPHHGINLWLQVQIFYDHVNPATRQTIDQSDGGKLRDINAEESWVLLEDLALYDNESWSDPRDFAKPVKAISLPQDVPSTFDRRLTELENQVQRLMEAHLAPKQPIQVNKITSSCEICNGPHDPHDTQYCMENPEQAFVEYTSSHTDEAGGKWYTFKPEQNNLGDTYNPSWKIHPNLRLSNFEADFKQQQSEMTNKIDTVLKDITDRITRVLPSDTVPQSFDTEFVCTKGDHGDVMFIEIVKKNDDSRKEEPEVDFMIIEDISSIIGHRLTQAVLGKHFVEMSNMTHDPSQGVVRFTNGTNEIAYKMPHKIEQYESLSNLEKEHTKSVYFRKEEDKRRGADYVISKILGFYKECLELGPEYLTGVTDEGGVT
ncbi:MAK10-like protein [Tanacetum coccineum]|uniref:MAK10-like protein n=1 Tax=Tanacetum coccineum TaxID=301880 RepID=A0ABQ5HYJ8_9ASTR